MWNRIGKLCLSSLLGLTLLLGALPASAAEAEVSSQHVNTVGFSTEFAEGELGVHLPTGDYYADVGISPGCGMSAPNAEAVRTWQSLAQSALLSGKTVSVGYSHCAGYDYIQWLTLNP
jgi:hypothetical protein